MEGGADSQCTRRCRITHTLSGLRPLPQDGLVRTRARRPLGLHSLASTSRDTRVHSLAIARITYTQWLPRSTNMGGRAGIQCYREERACELNRTINPDGKRGRSRAKPHNSDHRRAPLQPPHSPRQTSSREVGSWKGEPTVNAHADVGSHTLSQASGLSHRTDSYARVLGDH